MKKNMSLKSNQLLKSKETPLKVVWDNWYCMFEVAYNEHHSCSESGCDEEGICRCGVIEGAHVKEIHRDSISYRIAGLNYPKDNELIKYGLERIFIALNLCDISRDYYSVKVERGYYGEEIGGVELENSIEKKLINTVQEFLKSKNKVEFLLNLEYQHVLPILKNKTWSVQYVYREQVVPGNNYYENMVKRSPNPYGSDYTGVIAVCLKEGDTYRIYDGYHRWLASTQHTGVHILLGEDTYRHEKVK